MQGSQQNDLSIVLYCFDVKVAPYFLERVYIISHGLNNLGM